MKTEFKIGEELQFGLIKLKCVESDNECDGCFLDVFIDLNICHLIGKCSRSSRSDGNSVKFIENK